jgi:hypothetical protein
MIADDLPNIEFVFAFTYVICRRLSFYATGYSNLLSLAEASKTVCKFCIKSLFIYFRWTTSLQTYFLNALTPVIILRRRFFFYDLSSLRNLLDQAFSNLFAWEKHSGWMIYMRKFYFLCILGE